MKRETFSANFFQFMGETQKTAYEVSSEFQPRGLTKLEYTLIEHLYYEEDQSLKRMTEMILVSENRCRKHLKLLLEKSFIQKSKDPSDGRRQLYNITRAGKLKLDECYFLIIKTIQKKFDHLTDEQVKNIDECMTYIEKTLYKA